VGSAASGPVDEAASATRGGGDAVEGGVVAVADPELAARPAVEGGGGVGADPDPAGRPGVGGGDSDDPLDGLARLGVDAEELPVAPELPVAGRGALVDGAGALGVLSRGVTGSGGRDGWTVLLGPPHGTKEKRLRGRSLPNHPTTDGPTSRTRTSATPTPSAMRTQRTLKMLGRRRMRCDTSDLTRLILEFPKYGRMLAS
jgi:hypothetical protein